MLRGVNAHCHLLNISASTLGAKKGRHRIISLIRDNPALIRLIRDNPPRIGHSNDKPTAWCIANEQQIIVDTRRAAAEEAARAAQAAARAAETARRAARQEAARERTRTRMAALRLAKKDKGVDMPLPDSEDDDDW